eukprot:NODE_67_length_25542_cov_1.476831.p5 type:complete len:561 gc:universal NODE_67_length_25542_cov_1.476831:1887-205(-)
MSTRPIHEEGNAGRKVLVTTNHVKIKALPTIPLYIYHLATEKKDKDGSIVPMKKRERDEHVNAFIKMILKKEKVFASGNLIISFTPDLDKLYQVPLGMRFNRETQSAEENLVPMELKFTVKRNLQDLLTWLNTDSDLDSSEVQDLLQACDVLIKFDPTFKRLVMGVGMLNPLDVFDVRNTCLYMMKGIQCNTKVAKSGLILNVDAKYKTFFKEINLLDAFNESKLRSASQLQQEFKGIKVEILANTTLRKNARIVGISNLNANNFKIDVGEGKQISVAQYFQSKGIKLRYPTTNLVCVNKAKNTFYPPELLKIAPYQTYEKPVPDVNAIRRETCLRPEDRKKYILNALKTECLQIRNGTRFSIDRDLMKIPGRFLDPPKPLVKGKAGRLGSSNAIELRNVPFAFPCAITSYAIVNFTHFVSKESVEQNLIQNIQKVARGHGVQFPRGKPIIIDCPINPNRPYVQFEEIAENALKEAATAARGFYKSIPQILFCISPSQTCGVYNHMKRLTETTSFFGGSIILTQFLDGAKFKEIRGRITVNPQYCTNLLLKINEKLSYVM